MSVINRMLQDLQSRKAGLSNSPESMMPVMAKPAGKLRLLVLLVGGGALVAAVAYVPLPMIGNATASHMPKPVAMIAEAQAPAMAPAASKPVANDASGEMTPVAVAPTTPPPIAATQMTVPASASASAAAALPPPDPSPASEQVPVLGKVDKRVLDETPRQRAQNFYRQGNDQAATGHVRQAVELALAALKADPSYVDARQFAVSLMYEQQRSVEAEALAREGLAMSGQQGRQGPLAYLLARMLSDRGNNREAVALLDQQPNLTADGHGLRAGILSQSGDFKRASQDYQSAATQQPDNSLWWFGLGVAQEALGQPQEAKRMYAKAQTLGMDRADLTAFIDQKLRTLN